MGTQVVGLATNTHNTGHGNYGLKAAMVQNYTM